MKYLLNTALVFLLSCAISKVSAQTGTHTNKANAAKVVTEKKEIDKKNEADKKPNAGPFHAKLTAVDKKARTITVGKRTFFVTAETKFNKAGKPAAFDDGVIGEPVSGYVKPNDEGKLVATKVNFGPKVEGATSESKKKK